MPKVIDPAVWNDFLHLLRTGYSREAACRMTGVSRGTARDFLRGDSASARRWRQIRAGQPCPLCGCDEHHAGDD